MKDALVIQVPRDSPVQRQLDAEAPATTDDTTIVVEALAPDAEGNLDPPAAGEVVLPSPPPSHWPGNPKW